MTIESKKSSLLGVVIVSIGKNECELVKPIREIELTSMAEFGS
jgi:hypothetical protein